MTPAQLRTGRDALGISAQFLADRAGVHVNMVWRCESATYTGDVTERLADTMIDLSDALETAVARVARDFGPDDALPRYAELADFWTAVPELEGWPQTSQGLLLDAARAEIFAAHRRSPRITYYTSEMTR